MTELKARLFRTGEDVIIEDAEPCSSAQLFKAISDKIWEAEPKSKLACQTVENVLSPSEARDAINDVVRSIDERFVISGVGKALNLGPAWYGDHAPVIVESEIIDNIASTAIRTFNWDDRMTYRMVEIDGESMGAQFIDGHTDYYRELSAMFFNETGTISYVMQRQQEYQNMPTNMYLNYWHRDFAETGYEGHQLSSASLSEEQEIKLLEVMQRIGGIELDA